MNQGVRRRALMKKTRGKISRVSVPLSLFGYQLETTEGAAMLLDLWQISFQPPWKVYEFGLRGKLRTIFWLVCDTFFIKVGLLVCYRDLYHFRSEGHYGPALNVVIWFGSIQWCLWVMIRSHFLVLKAAMVRFFSALMVCLWRLRLEQSFV